ncbi:MAG: MauE/DoxX family redox-associated membrane protein [Ferruginibacter sp.]
MAANFNRLNNIITEISTSLMIALFSYTAVTKLIGHQTFFNQLKDTPFIGNYASMLTWLIPALEIATACLLVFKSTWLFGLYCSSFLMTSFTIYILIILWSSDPRPCSCGGFIQAMTWTQHLSLNIAFLLLGVYTVFISYRNKKQL